MPASDAMFYFVGFCIRTGRKDFHQEQFMYKLPDVIRRAITSGMMERADHKKNSLSRVLFLVMGLVSVGLGLLGAILPILPTTPFMILGLWCFARSSERFHNWLYNHRLFGPPLQKWEEHRVIPPVAKFASVSAMALSMVIVVLYSTAPWYSLAAMGIFLVTAAWFILSKPSRVISD